MTKRKANPQAPLTPGVAHEKMRGIFGAEAKYFLVVFHDPSGAFTTLHTNPSIPQLSGVLMWLWTYITGFFSKEQAMMKRVEMDSQIPGLGGQTPAQTG